jgi:hypothetical protein
MYQKLAAKLLRLLETDQDMRAKAQENAASWNYSLDKSNAEQLKKIVKLHGWPTIPMVGEEASNAAWLIAQHADHDLVFQEQCLAILIALPKGDIKLANIAYLEDRVLTNKGKPQIYGTQFQGTGINLKPQPIKNIAQLDKRRAAMGLGTFGDYLKLMEESYGKT